MSSSRLGRPARGAASLFLDDHAVGMAKKRETRSAACKRSWAMNLHGNARSSANAYRGGHRDEMRQLMGQLMRQLMRQTRELPCEQEVVRLKY